MAATRTATEPENVLFYGDNLDVLRRHVKDESVDLVYLDPPFNSNADYNAFFAEQDGSRSAAQIKAFGDTWTWDQAAAAALHDFTVSPAVPDRAKQALLAFEALLGHSNMLAYLAMMAPRLVELWRVLRPTGSLYLHCDSTASHYLKLLLDAVFGVENFTNEIVWQRTSSHNDPSRYGRVHDVILYYGKTQKRIWNQYYDAPDFDFFKAHDFEIDEQGRRFRKRDLTAPSHGRDSGQYEWKGKRPPSGRMWSYTHDNMKQLEAEGRIIYTRTGMPRLKIYVENLKGLPYQDIWAKPELWLNSAAKERLGYPTQKPLALLERIIQASSNEGDTVLDPFCGCGTTVAAAQKLGRRWIGIDITSLATSLIKNRLLESYGKGIVGTYRVVGEPVSVQDAAHLAANDPYQFQWWALGLVGARPIEQKKGADKGIDGRLYFHDEGQGGKAKQVIFSVKAGKNVSVPMVRDLGHVVDREKAQVGLLITMSEPTGPMRAEAAGAGFYVPPGHLGSKHPRLQILTVAELLAGAQVDLPRVSDFRTFKKAPKVSSASREQAGILDFDAAEPDDSGD